MTHPLSGDSSILAGLHGTPIEFEKTAKRMYAEYQRYIPGAKRKYPSLTGEEIQNCYNDALGALIQKVVGNTFDEKKASLSTLFCQIFFNKCIDQLRRNTNQKSEWKKQLGQLFPELPAESIDVLGELIQQDTFNQVKGLLDELKPPCKSLIMDLDYWGFSPEEAATRNGYKNGHSASQAKYRCIQALRKKLRKRNGG